MAHFKIEIFRHGTWLSRGEGDADISVDQLVAEMVGMSSIGGYEHRGYIDGKLAVETLRPHGRRGKTQIIRHDA